MKLKLRLTLWFLAISLIPMSLVMYFSYSMTSNALTLQIYNQLDALANVQQNRIEALVAERRSELSKFTDRPQLHALLQSYWHTRDDAGLDRIDQLLSSMQLDQPHFREITFLDLEGKVLASTRRRRRHDLSGTPWFAAARTQSVANLEYDDKRSTLSLRVAGPLIESSTPTPADGNATAAQHQLVGVCVLVTDADALLNLAADRTGLGESGEFFVTERVPNSDVLAITALRRTSDGQLRLRVNRVGHDALGVRELMAIDQGVHKGVNFHGTAVLAAARQIGMQRWGLVVSLDEDEALAPVHRFRDLVLSAMVALMLLTVLASFSLARSITEPLDGLTQAAERASHGDLSARVRAASDGEIGILESAFNHMSERLEAMHQGLETKVAERTAELKAANARLQELDQMKSEFLATMSHELRTPLSSILGFSEILSSESGGFDSEQREQLRCIHGSAKHLLQIIEEMLEVSKIESGQMLVEPQWFSMSDLVRQAADILRPQATRAKLDLTVAIDAPEPLLACSDPHKVLRALVNLIGNAVKFTVRGSVVVTTRVEGEVIVIEVADTGIGIRPDDLMHLFQPFKQLDSSTSRQYEGTGLGLYYSKKVVDMLGGTIAVKSIWQEGTTFIIRLPVRRPGAPARPQELEPTI